MTRRCWPLFDLRLASPELAAVSVIGLALTLVPPELAGRSLEDMATSA